MPKYIVGRFAEPHDGLTIRRWLAEGGLLLAFAALSSLLVWR